MPAAAGTSENQWLPPLNRHAARQVSNGWAFIGEPGKFVSASKKRFTKVEAAGSTLSVTVDVVTGETVKVCAAEASTLKLVCKTATASSTLAFP